jgi:tetratricopeptide (TPR) repeat protein
LFEQAIGADPRYAPAFAGLADCRNFLGDVPGAKLAARRALELDPNLPEAHAALGNAALFYDYDRSAAERAFREAIRLYPSYSTAHQWLAYCLASLGRFEDALAEIERARTIDPLSLSIATDVGDILLYARRYDDAARECRKAIAMDPHFLQGHVELVQILKAKGDFEGAIEEFSFSERKDLLASAYALAGRRNEARRLLAEFSAASPVHTGAWHWSAARVFASLGETDNAFASLQQAYESRFGQLVLLNVDPDADQLRSDPRFADLLRRISVGTSHG